MREEADWINEKNFEDDWIKQQLERLGHVAKQVHHFLAARGASFFHDIVRGTHHLKAEIETGLWELVTAGLVTADGFDNLRALIEPKRRTQKRYQGQSLRFNSGRWYLLHPTANDKTADPTKQLEALCRMLLKRYGVVFRDLITREKNLPRWRELLVVFRRLEDRGEVRGGRFVNGFFGEQFALPYAVESLRAMRKAIVNKQPVDATAQASVDDHQQNLKRQIIVSAVDPVNLVGIILPGDRVAAFSGKWVTMDY